jgi:hypothetical protein
MPTSRPTLVYLYGPPAVGKLTIAEKVHDLTGFPLFHNHLTVNAIRAVFDFGSPPFTEVIHRLRLDVFATAMRAGVSLVFTNNSAWAGPEGHDAFLAFTRSARDTVAGAGGRAAFVRLTAPLDVLESRVDTPSRRSHQKLLDATHLRELLAATGEPEVPDTVLRVDTSELSADRAAHAIVEAAA